MLFNNTRKKKKSHLHYGSAKKARQTIKYLKTRPRGERIRGAQSMYFRAKFHAQQTKNMREAMKVYKNFLQKIDKKKI
jgi:hypothetical protein